MVTQAKELDNKAQVAESGVVTEVDTAVGASFIACGIGSTIFGLGVIGAEVSVDFKNMLNLTNPVGPLSGKALLGVVAFLLSWAILHYVMKGKQVPLMTSFIIGTALTLLGVLFTYPPFFLLFAPA
jgi:hypothetical protein